jgi:hypothetical protein
MVGKNIILFPLLKDPFTREPYECNKDSYRKLIEYAEMEANLKNFQEALCYLRQAKCICLVLGSDVNSVLPKADLEELYNEFEAFSRTPIIVDDGINIK